MAICSRRTLQRLINENPRFLLKRQIRNHVDKLNDNDLAASKGQATTLATEWEIILLNAFSKIGKVEHERNFGGNTVPDLHFISDANPNHCFAADITAVSDRGFEGHNPFHLLWDELFRRVGDRGLRKQSFSVRVEGNYDELYREGPAARLKLPAQWRFEEKIFNVSFYEFLEEVARSPQKKAEHRVLKLDEKIDVTIGYDPQQMFASGGHLFYKKLSKLRQNVIYERLERKRSQLLESRFNGPIGIILCDGGFSIFNDSMLVDISGYSVSDVIKQFLLDYPDLHFVITFSVEQTTKRVLIRRCAQDSFRESHAWLLECVSRLSFPEMEMDPVNAMNHLFGENPQQGRYRRMGMSIGEKYTTVSISARALVELLAGRVSQQEFFERVEFVPSEIPSPLPVNPFAHALQKRQVVTEVALETAPSKDDELITFKLRGPDPAISPFVMPNED